jgi:hypothetical protein
MDIQSIEIVIKDFAFKYNFVLHSDIEKIETSDNFNKKDYQNIDGKKFISINKYFEKIIIYCGIIQIEIDEIEEEEWFSIEKVDIFTIDTFDFLTEDKLVEEIINKCKKYNVII